jgi:hypothetical protein
MGGMTCGGYRMIHLRMKKEHGISKKLVCEKKCEKKLRKIFVIKKFLLHLHSKPSRLTRN